MSKTARVYFGVLQIHHGKNVGDVSLGQTGMHCHALSRPDSRSDPIGGSKPVSRCETIYLGLFTFFFFFRAEIIPVGIQTIFIITKNHSLTQKNYHWCGIHKIYTHILSPIYLYKYLYLYIFNTNIRDRGTVLVSTYL